MNALVTLIISSFMLTGCMKTINSSKLIHVSLDMDKGEVIKSIGTPSVVRGSIKTNYGQVIEVWEYIVDQGKSSRQVGAGLALTALTFGLCAPVLFAEGETSAYWLYFCDGKLVKWGQAGDWSREADIIQEIRFDASPKL